MTHILILGGGIAGLTTAWALARRGVQVTLFEQGPLPNPTSSSFDEHRIIRHAYGPMQGYARLMPGAYALWNQLWADLGETHYEETGALTVMRDDQSWVDPAIQSLNELGIPYEDIPLERLPTRYPMLEPGGITRATLTAGAGMLFPSRILPALVARLPAMGVTLVANTAVTSIDPDAASLTANGERHQADALVICAGPWTDRLVPSLRSIAVPSRQAVLYLAPPPDLAAAWAQAPVIMIRAKIGGTYTLPPRRGTRLKIGDHLFSRRGNPDDDRIAHPEDLEHLIPALAVGYRDIARYQILERKACFYTVTHDEGFIVKPLAPNTWVTSACSGHGFKLAPAMANAVAAALTKERPAHEIPQWAAPL